jgi:hypothetical protein
MGAAFSIISNSGYIIPRTQRITFEFLLYFKTVNSTSYRFVDNKVICSYRSGSIHALHLLEEIVEHHVKKIESKCQVCGRRIYYVRPPSTVEHTKLFLVTR